MRINTSNLGKRILNMAKKRNISLGHCKRQEVTRSEKILSCFDDLTFTELNEIIKKYKDRHNVRLELDYETDSVYSEFGSSNVETYFLTVCWEELETDEEAAKRVIADKS